MSTLAVIAGPMFAGKTKALIESMRSSGGKVIAFKSALDNRYHKTDLASHDGRFYPAVGIPPESGLDMLLQRAQGHDLIGIDECQFLPASLPLVVEALLARGSSVICAGLDMTHQGRGFGPMPELLAMADVVTKITATCECGAPANQTYRNCHGSALIEVGAHELYQARCRACWTHGNHGKIPMIQVAQVDHAVGLI